jgi:hypothetical protein
MLDSCSGNVVKHSGLWVDFVRLMHLPLPFCVLAFATIGAAVSERVYPDRLALTYVGILLALCLGAYSLDELHGRPYHTKFSDRTLWSMAAVGMASASIVAIYLAMTVNVYIMILAALASFFVFSYNLELFGGKFHNAAWFGLSWGGISTLAGYYVQAATINLSSLMVAGMASLLSVGILYLTHKFRPRELSKRLGGNIQMSALVEYSRDTRRIAWTVARIECYAMVLLAIGLIIPKLI